MIMPLDNNPLKFSPTVEAALIHLLAPSMPGFMPPLRAMKSAYDDLRAHQVGFLAGMRAALDEVLARFAPDELEKRLSDPAVLDSVLPMNRKAKLWDLFVERYGDVAGEAREDFNTAFGKAFRRAYDAQVKQAARRAESELAPSRAIRSRVAPRASRASRSGMRPLRRSQPNSCGRRAARRT